MKPCSIGLLGDYSADVPAHVAIPFALELARARAKNNLAWRWVETRELGASAKEAANTLRDCAAIWAVPASPYANAAGVLGAIQWARESRRPFLGTCGGFQHAILEFARNVAGIRNADHAETSPESSEPVITKLACSLIETAAPIRCAPGSRLAAAYGAEHATERYRCSFGLNNAYRARLEAAGLRFTAFDSTGDVRGAELPSHPFFVGTLFQPERAALEGELPPLVAAFAAAAAKASQDLD